MGTQATWGQSEALLYLPQGSSGECQGTKGRRQGAGVEGGHVEGGGTKDHQGQKGNADGSAQ